MFFNATESGYEFEQTTSTANTPTLGKSNALQDPYAKWDGIYLRSTRGLLRFLVGV